LPTPLLQSSAARCAQPHLHLAVLLTCRPATLAACFTCLTCHTCPTCHLLLDAQPAAAAQSAQPLSPVALRLRLILPPQPLDVVAVRPHRPELRLPPLDCRRVAPHHLLQHYRVAPPVQQQMMVAPDKA